jgi:hypothetical protein
MIIYSALLGLIIIVAFLLGIVSMAIIWIMSIEIKKGE